MRLANRAGASVTARMKPTIATTMAPRNAAQKSCTVKPRWSWTETAPTSRIMKALMISRKMPRVRMLMGSVTTRRIGRR